MRVLFLNHTTHNCGVYQYGLRLYQILAKHLATNSKYDFIYTEIGSHDAYIKSISTHTPQVILYNYHCATMPWLRSDVMPRNIIHVGIPHESPSWFFQHIIEINPMGSGFTIPRPMIEPEVLQQGLSKVSSLSPNLHHFITYEQQNIPIIGSFGFGFANKGFHKIVERVNQEFDDAIIKFVIPIAHFDPESYMTIQRARQACEVANKKAPRIKLLITHEFLSEEQLMVFLNSNTINLFMYDEMAHRGISSALDYALSCGRPIGLSNSHMFRHVYAPEISLAHRSIRECIQSEWNLSKNPSANNQQLAAKMQIILDTICNADI